MAGLISVDFIQVAAGPSAEQPMRRAERSLFAAAMDRFYFALLFMASENSLCPISAAALFWRPETGDALFPGSLPVLR
jgi:hypothetical protein